MMFEESSILLPYTCFLAIDPTRICISFYSQYKFHQQEYQKQTINIFVNGKILIS